MISDKELPLAGPEIAQGPGDGGFAEVDAVGGGFGVGFVAGRF
jgi:hypothetical protein